MKKLICLFSAIALIFTSCSSDDAPAPIPTPIDTSGVLVTRIIETFDDGSTLTTNYTYDGKKLIGYTDSDDDGSTFVYDANGKLISGTETYYDYMTDAPKTVNVVYTYNTAGKLISKETGDGILTEYIYNVDGTITEDSYDSGGSLAGSLRYSFSGDNMVSETGLGISSGISGVFNYDSLNSPFKNIFIPNLVLKIYMELDFNNEIETVYNDDANNAESSTSTYTFNSYSFPLTRTETFGNGDLITTQYFYNQ